MVKKTVVLLMLLFPVVASSQQDEGIRFFEGTWAEVLAEARTHDRLIFLDAYASWCGPCIRMARDVFPLKPVGDFYNGRFINVKIDMEKGEGVALAKLYNVRAYPTLLFINWRGEVVHRGVGGKSEEGLLELGRVALDDTRNLRSLEQAYRSHPDDVNRLINYATALRESYDRSYTALVSEFMVGKPLSLLMTATGWRIMENFVDNPESPEFLYLLENRTAFAARFGDSAVDRVVGQVVQAMISQAVRQNNAQAMQQLMQQIDAINPNNKAYFKALAGAQYSRRNNDWEAYASSVKTIITDGPAPDSRSLNRYAWDFYQSVENQEHLQWMASQVANMLRRENGYALRDTYAALLHKTGNNRQALREARAAVELAKKEETSYEDTLELIARIEAAMKR
jgi:thiol-disulfide isomerase/thioredoxin